LLWDQASGYYFDLDIRSDKFIKIPAISSFVPLFAGVADQNQAQQLLEHLLNPQEFATPIPFPTVARNHIEFEKDCWRGPVWINMAYLVIQGMKRYGFKQAAVTQSQSLVDGVYKTWANTGAFVEYYDPDRFDFKQLSRKKGEGLFSFFSASRDPWKILMHLVGKQMYLGQKPVSHFIGWTGLVNNLAIEELDFKVQN
jgi:neutral trehalase